jgi:uncharacterized protein involved in response to NO
MARGMSVAPHRFVLEWIRARPEELDPEELDPEELDMALIEFNQASRSRLALWQLGFRPFFLLGLLAAPMLVALWLAALLRGPSAVQYFAPTYWHGHEMIFGFATAIVIGFIYTASQNWTGTPGIRGPRLVLLAGLWLAARVLMAFPILPRGLVAAIDLAFLPAAACFLVPYLGRKEQRHNLIFLVLLSALTIGNLLMHLSALGILVDFDRRGLYLGLDVIILMIVTISGRIVPMFSERAVPGYVRTPSPWLDRAALASAVFYAVCDFALPMSALTALVAAAAAGINLGRWVRWHHRGIWRVPILWVLYVGYAWIAVGFALRAATRFAEVPISTATHAFTVGAIGTMIIAMISRVSLGHTGRAIRASRPTIAAYAFVTTAATARVVGSLPLGIPQSIALTVAGSLWVAAFGLLLVVYAPILLMPRVDGKPG